MIPKRIQFSIKTQCQFKCDFCVYDGDVEKLEAFDMNRFKEFADKFYAFGVREFELTPVTGDMTFDYFLAQKLDYLTELGAEKIVLFTNAYAMNEACLNYLAKYPALELNISIYGGSIPEYKERTGRDAYTRVVTNLGKLIADERFQNVVIHKRYSGSTKPRLLMWYRCAEELGYKVWDCSHDTNWKGMVESNCDLGSTTKGVCRFALEDNAVLPNGDITLCGWFDINKTMIIGNLYEQELSEIYSEDSRFSKIINEQANGVYRGLCCTCTMRNDQRN
jgi:MoaA/NifB/PqqE/SkfB family radical SAM enzyme